jgi:hypothetical protein
LPGTANITAIYQENLTTMLYIKVANLMPFFISKKTPCLHFLAEILSLDSTSESNLSHFLKLRNRFLAFFANN